MKKRKNESVLKPFLKKLIKMKEDKISLSIVQEYLKSKNVIVVPSTISRYVNKYAPDTNKNRIKTKVLFDQRIGSITLKCTVLGENLRIDMSCKPSFSPAESHSISISLKNLQ